jgi:hypothetical protein
MSDILRLHSAGYRLVFLAAGGKVPDRKGWQSADLPDDYVVSEAARVRDGVRSVGMVHGSQASGTIDIETDSAVGRRNRTNFKDRPRREQQWQQFRAVMAEPIRMESGLKLP